MLSISGFIQRLKKVDVFNGRNGDNAKLNGFNGSKFRSFTDLSAETISIS